MMIRTTLRLAAYGAMACGLLFSSVQPAEARDKMTRKEKNTLIGVGIGALGGALLSKGDMWSTIAGAAAGGAIGNVTTKNRRDHHDDRRWDDDRYRDRDRRHWDR